MFCKDTFSSYGKCEYLLKLIDLYKVLILEVIVRELIILAYVLPRLRSKSREEPVSHYLIGLIFLRGRSRGSSALGSLSSSSIGFYAS